MRELTNMEIHAISGGIYDEIARILLLTTVLGGIVLVATKMTKLQHDHEIELAKYQAFYGKLASENAINN